MKEADSLTPAVSGLVATQRPPDGGNGPYERRRQAQDGIQEDQGEDAGECEEHIPGGTAFMGRRDCRSGAQCVPAHRGALHREAGPGTIYSSLGFAPVGAVSISAGGAGASAGWPRLPSACHRNVSGVLSLRDERVKAPARSRACASAAGERAGSSRSRRGRAHGTARAARTRAALPDSPSGHATRVGRATIARRQIFERPRVRTYRRLSCPAVHSPRKRSYCYGETQRSAQLLSAGMPCRGGVTLGAAHGPWRPRAGQPGGSWRCPLFVAATRTAWLIPTRR